ncbi:hypothetical protein [Aridibaculum aurantiacum]|uniref:hypothetical protein n=1 Tax=Aridibaculum aurantiacum TaxID=2810307 RepID=UPI001A95CE48|nr:hypothetical protein [Aridibaculum aurantiacum]
MYIENELDLFDNYLSGSLEASDKLLFEHQLSENRALKNRFQVFKGLVEQVQNEAAIEHSLKARFRQLDKKKSRKKWFFYSGIAASALMVLASVSIFSTRQQKVDISRYQVNEPGLPITMSVDNEANWQDIMQLFKAEQYDKAYALVAAKQQTDTALYFSGLFLELQGNRAGAMKKYKELQQFQHSSIFIQKGTYRQALLLWQAEQQEAAMELLKNIAADKGHFYQQQASDAVEALSTK